MFTFHSAVFSLSFSTCLCYCIVVILPYKLFMAACMYAGVWCSTVVKDTTKEAKNKTYSSANLFPMSFCSNCSFCTTIEVILHETRREMKFSQRSFHGPFRQMPGENFIRAKTDSFQNLSNIQFSNIPYMYAMLSAQQTALKWKAYNLHKYNDIWYTEGFYGSFLREVESSARFLPCPREPLNY